MFRRLNNQSRLKFSIIDIFDEMKKNEAQVIVEDIFDAPIEKVWKAITGIEEMKIWYFENIDVFKAEIGSKSKFVVQSDERTFTHLWEVTEVDAPNKITYNWKYEEYPGDSFVTWELFDESGKTKLVLTTRITEDFPDEIPEFKRESCKKGWEYFICWKLKEYLME